MIIKNLVIGTEIKKLSELKKFQGNLKKIGEDELQKLKNSILTDGFAAPIYVWGDEILDGHQRLHALSELKKKDYFLENDEVPVVRIKAPDKKTAAKLVLKYNSQYAEISIEGLKEFLKDMELDLSEIEREIHLNLDTSKLLNENNSEEEQASQQNDKDAKTAWLGANKLTCMPNTTDNMSLELQNKKKDCKICFGDSYNTMILCEKLGLEYYINEPNESKFLEVIRNWEKLTGLKAIKE